MVFLVTLKLVFQDYQIKKKQLLTLLHKIFQKKRKRPNISFTSWENYSQLKNLHITNFISNLPLKHIFS